MFFCVDIGNTNTVIGMWRDDVLVARWRIETDRNATFDDLTAKLHVLMTVAGIERAEIKKVVVSSVVPVWDHAWERFSREYFSREPLFITARTVTGLVLALDNPSEVGADRIVNAVAAIERFPQGAIVVDSGTAITVDVVSPDRRYLGGAIMPGILIALEALSARTAKLPRIALERPSSPIGRSTTTGIQSGIYYGFAGMVDRVVEEIRAGLDFSPRVIATGGLAGSLSQISRHIEEYDRDLTLRGILLIAKRN